MKKLLTLLLTLIMVVCLVNLNNNHAKADNDNNNPVTETFYWGIDSNNVLHLSNSDDFSLFEEGKHGSTDGIYAYVTPWSSYKTTITKVKIDNAIVPSDTSFWFSELANATSIENLNNLDTSNVGSMYGMFMNSPKLENLDLSTFNTSGVENMGWMFSGCTNLESVNLSNFDTSKVTSFLMMFSMCENLEVIDLSSFSFIGAPETQNMFSGCSKLKTIYATDYVKGSNNDLGMFANCKKLVGGDGTSFDSSKVGYTYARVDGKGDLKGYFTYPAYISINRDKNVHMLTGATTNVNLSINGPKSQQTYTYNVLSSDENVATANISTNVLTINGIGNGDATITIQVSKATNSEVLYNYHIYVSVGEDTPEIVEPQKEYKKGNDLTMISNDELSAFAVVDPTTGVAILNDNCGVKVDGKEIIVNIDYTVKEGSIKIILSKSYLNTLGSGSHNIEIVSENGTATGKVVVKSDTPTPSPKDNSCEKVIGPTWHWNNTKGVCEEYATVGTSTR